MNPLQTYTWFWLVMGSVIVFFLVVALLSVNLMHQQTMIDSDVCKAHGDRAVLIGGRVLCLDSERRLYLPEGRE